MNWDNSIENFKNYLKLERGLSTNSIKSYEYDLIQFKKYVNDNLKHVTLYKPQNQKECDKVIELIIKNNIK